MTKLSYDDEARYIELPEGATARCRYCNDSLVLDQREGGGPGKDWGSGSFKKWLELGHGLDYGCGAHPGTSTDGTYGHVPIFDTIRYHRTHKDCQAWLEGEPARPVCGVCRSGWRRTNKGWIRTFRPGPVRLKISFSGDSTSLAHRLVVELRTVRGHARGEWHGFDWDPQVGDYVIRLRDPQADWRLSDVIEVVVP